MSLVFLLSPSKTQTFERPNPADGTQPTFLKAATQLMKQLQGFSEGELAELMHLSPKLAAATHAHCQAWRPTHSAGKAIPAIFAFAGEAFESLDASSLAPEALAFAQVHLRVLSGLYGLLRPLDLMRPHRLEMATRLPQLGPLTAFWSERITEALRKEIGHGTLVNLASQEYSQVVKLPMLNLHFQEPDGRVQSFAAKRARGLMARWAMQNRFETPEPLKDFREGGYKLKAATESDWTFRRS